MFTAPGRSFLRNAPMALLLGPLLVLGPRSALNAQTKPATTGQDATFAPKPIDIDPQAKRALDEMVHAYRGIRRFEQDTGYTVDEGVQNHLVRTRLVVQKPNRLFLELIQQTTERNTPWLSRFQSDGKVFYSYQEKNGWYKKDKAPKNLKEFDFLAVSLEMAAIIGMDPLPPLLAQARSVRIDTPQQADGVMTTVVVIDTSSVQIESETRLYIGQDDHLLRRFEIMSKPRPQQPAAAMEKVDKSIVTESRTDEEPARPILSTSRFSYDNHVRRDKEMTRDAFAWVAPPNSFPFTSYPSAFDSKVPKSLGQPGDTSTAMPPGITPMKVISLQDLMKNAKKNTQKQQKKR